MKLFNHMFNEIFRDESDRELFKRFLTLMILKRTDVFYHHRKCNKKNRNNRRNVNSIYSAHFPRRRFLMHL